MFAVGAVARPCDGFSLDSVTTAASKRLGIAAPALWVCRISYSFWDVVQAVIHIGVIIFTIIVIIAIVVVIIVFIAIDVIIVIIDIVI